MPSWRWGQYPEAAAMQSLPRRRWPTLLWLSLRAIPWLSLRALRSPPCRPLTRAAFFMQPDLAGHIEAEARKVWSDVTVTYAAEQDTVAPTYAEHPPP